MRLDPDWLSAQPVDEAALLHSVDTALAPERGPDRIGIAVSGGGDSVALLHVCYRWSEATGVPLAAVTLDHGLRPEAAQEARWVAALCARLGVSHRVLHWDGTQARGNRMAAARDARYRLIGAWAKAEGISGVALGHTADDVAETFLMRLGRKAGLDGLSAMPARFERAGITWVRPFWQQTRADLRAYLRRHGQDWLEDPTNADPGYDRTRARAVMAALAPLGIDAEGLTQTAHALRMARSALEQHTAEEAHRVVEIDRGDVLIPRRPRPPVHPEIDRRLLGAAIRWVGGQDYAPRADAMINLDAALVTGAKRHSVAGCLVTVEEGPTWRISREPKAVADVVAPVGELWDGRWLVEGPGEHGMKIKALGEAGLAECPDWRVAGLPRQSLLASPAIWVGGRLIAAPIAGYGEAWSARIVADFQSRLLSH